MSSLFFANPDGLWALAALAAVAALYLFRRRRRPLAVTGLFLWGAPPPDADGGRSLRPPRAGRSLVLDLLAAALLGLALAGPAWRSEAGRRLVVILDDSFAMRSRGCRDLAADLAERLIREAEPGAAALVLAGRTPSVLAGFGSSRAEAAAALERYRPAADAADLQAAAELARDLYGSGPDLAAITNRESGLPATGAGGPTVHVLAGRGANLALTRLWRERLPDGSGRERLTLAVANYSDRAARAPLRVDPADGGGEGAVHAETLFLPAGGTVFVEIELAAFGNAVLAVRLAVPPTDDAIAEDSLVFAPPTPERSVGYGLKDLGEATARLFRLGLEAAGCRPAAEPDLLVSGDHEARGRALTVRLPEPTDPGVFGGPCVVDRASDLGRDLDLAGIPWVAADRIVPAAPERVFILAGDTPVFWQTAPGLLDLNLWPERSALAREPAWPALMVNLATEAGRRLPGLGKALYRPGELLRFRTESGAPAGPLRLFAGSREVAASPSGREFALPAEAGLYRLRGPAGEPSAVAVLPFYGKASDTTVLAASARVVSPAGSDGEDGEGALDLTWLAVLLGMAALGLNWLPGRR